MKSPITFLLIIVLPVAVHSQEQKKTTAAVLDFAVVQGMSPNEGVLLSEKFRSSCSRTRKFIFLTRTEMEEIAKEQHFSLTDLCDQENCAVKVGKQLTAAKIIFGRMGKVGQTYTVNAKILDVTTGTINTEVDRQYRGEIDGLFKVFDEMALDLMGIKPKPKWPWILGGVVIAGGGAAFLLKPKPAKDPFGTPPGPPQ